MTSPSNVNCSVPRAAEHAAIDRRRRALVRALRGERVEVSGAARGDDFQLALFLPVESTGRSARTSTVRRRRSRCRCTSRRSRRRAAGCCRCRRRDGSESTRPAADRRRLAATAVEPAGLDRADAAAGAADEDRARAHAAAEYPRRDKPRPVLLLILTGTEHHRCEILGHRGPTTRPDAGERVESCAAPVQRRNASAIWSPHFG